MGFLTVHLSGVCCDFLPLLVNLLIPVQIISDETIPKSTDVMQEFRVIWLDRSLQWAKGCRAESQLKFSKQGCYYSSCLRKRPSMSIFIYLKSALFLSLSYFSILWVGGLLEFLILIWYSSSKSLRNFMGTPAVPHSLQADGRCLLCHLLSSGPYFCIGGAVTTSLIPLRITTSLHNAGWSIQLTLFPFESVWRSWIRTVGLIKLVLIQKDDFEFMGAHWFFFCGLKTCPLLQMNHRNFHLLSVAQGFLSSLWYALSILEFYISALV